MAESHIMNIPPQNTAEGNTEGVLVNEPKPNASGNDTNPPVKQYTWQDFVVGPLKEGWKQFGETVHTGLDVAGAIPVVGAVADALNSGIYVAEGDYTNAAISGGSALLDLIPGAGTAAKGAKFAYKAGSAVARGAARGAAKAAERAGIRQAEKSAIKNAEKGVVNASEREAVTAAEKNASKAAKEEEGIAVKKEKENSPLKDCPAVGNPVNPILGIKCLTDEAERDFTLPAVLPLLWQRSYFSDQQGNGWLGQGWSLPFSRRLIRRDERMMLIDHQGRTIRLPALDEGECKFLRHEQLFIAREGNGRYGITALSERLSYVFAPLALDGDDPQGRLAPYLPLIAIRNTNGIFIRLLYNNAGLPANIIDAAGRHLNLHFTTLRLRDGNDVQRLQRVTLLHNPTNLQKQPSASGGETLVTYRYSAEGDLIGVLDTHGQLRREYDYKNHILTQHRNAGGLIVQYEYDDYSMKGKVIRQLTNLGQVWLFDYRDGETLVTDPLQRVIRYQYNENKQFTGFVDANGYKTTATLDKTGRPLVITTPGGKQTRYAYDQYGKVTSVTDAFRGRTAIRYDADHRPIAVTDSVGRTTAFDYDPNDEFLQITDAQGHITKHYYDDRGLLAAVQDSAGRVRRMEYDRAGLLIASTDCSGNTTRLVRGIKGNVTRVTYPDGTQAHAISDAQGKPLSTLYADGAVERYLYDVPGRQVSKSNALGHQTRWHLDLDGRPLRRVDACNGTFHYQYDNARRLICLTNENGDKYHITYDASDNVVCEQDFNGIVTRYSYDDDGFMIYKHESGIQAPEILTFYQRDDAGRIIEKIIRDQTFTQESGNYYRYDAAGNMTEARNAHSTVTFTYDKAGLLIAESCEVAGKRFLVEHTYDSNGNRCKTRLPEGGCVEYLYYGSGHLLQINLDGNTLCESERDSMHREICRTQGNLISHFQYNPHGWLLSQNVVIQTVSSDVSAPVILRHYQYDKAGNLQSMTDMKAGTKQYQYDPLGRLTQCDEERFIFDPAHNVIDGNNRSSEKGYRFCQGQHYASDAYGNINEIKGVNGQHLRLYYDLEHQLERVETKHNGVNQITRYAYDALGRRIYKQIGEDIVFFCWDGDRLLSESRGIKSITYLYEPDGFIPVAQCVQKGQQEKSIYYYHTDQIGMPCELSTPEGKIVWQARYKAWGNRCSSEISVPTKGSEAEQPLRFQGQYYDEESGLHYNRYRYYDPCTGRFITPDPIGLAGGENAYRYAPNPTVWRDPLGLMNPPPVPGGSGGNPGFSSGNIGKASYEFDHMTRNLSIISHGAPFITQTDRLASGSTLAKQVKDVTAREGFQVNRVQLQSCYSGVGGSASLAQQLANRLGKPVTGYSGRFSSLENTPVGPTGGNSRTFTPSTSNVGRSVSSAVNRAGGAVAQGVVKTVNAFRRT